MAKLTINNKKQFLKEDSQGGVSKHHKKYLGIEVPEGYFVKSHISILQKIKPYTNEEVPEKTKKRSVFSMQPRVRYMAVASLAFILSLTIWLQSLHENETLNETNIDVLTFSDAVLIESLLVNENEVDAFADAILFREVLVESEVFEQKIENLVFENLILEDSLLNNFEYGLIETIIL